MFIHSTYNTVHYMNGNEAKECLYDTCIIVNVNGLFHINCLFTLLY